MKLSPLDSSTIDLAAKWLAYETNYQWLDFGGGSQVVTPVLLAFMQQRDVNLLRLFAADSNDTPIGLVALSNISRGFKTATLWYVLGDKTYADRGYTSRAVSDILSIAFAETGLQTINAWAVECNLPSLRVLAKNHFRLIGRQRQCHFIDGRAFDRLLFDLIAPEHARSSMGRRPPAAGSSSENWVKAQ